ncbi:hypothetical protein ACROYT_G012261 [Oculina patagonica]
MSAVVLFLEAKKFYRKSDSSVEMTREQNGSNPFVPRKANIALKTKPPCCPSYSRIRYIENQAALNHQLQDPTRAEMWLGSSSIGKSSTSNP